MNIWRRGPVTQNPYRITAFKALGIDTEEVSRAAIDQRVAERREAIANVPGYYTLDGRPLTQAEVNAARQVLLDPTRRILEELLEHRPARPQLDEVERAAARLQPPPPLPPEAPRLRFLLRVVQDLARASLDDLPPVEVPPYPVDLRPIPPFGPAPAADDD